MNLPGNIMGIPRKMVYNYSNDTIFNIKECDEKTAKRFFCQAFKKQVDVRMGYNMAGDICPGGQADTTIILIL